MDNKQPIFTVLDGNANIAKKPSKGYNVDNKTARNEITEAIRQAAPSQEGGNAMNDDFFKILLKDMKDDAREREKRYHEEAKEREERYRKEDQERENRFTETTNTLKNEMGDLKHSVSNSLNRIEGKLERFEDKMDATNKHVQTMAMTNLWSGIATILAIASFAVTVIIFAVTHH